MLQTHNQDQDRDMQRAKGKELHTSNESAEALEEGQRIAVDNQDSDDENDSLVSANRSSQFNVLGFCLQTEVWSSLGYASMSVAMTLVNKAILNIYHFQPKMALLLLQNVLCLVWLVGARWLNLVKFDLHLDPKSVRAWIPLNILFLGMLLTSFLSMQYLSVPMITIFKNCTNILACFGDYYLYGQPISNGILGSLMLILFAAIFTAKYDLEYNFYGYAYAGLNCVVTASYLLYMPMAMKGATLNSFGKVYYNNLLSVPLILILDTLGSGECLSILLNKDHDSVTLLTSLSFLTILNISGALGFALSFVSFICVQSTSPTTYAMVGALSKVPLTIIGIIIFSTKVDLNSFVFISLSIAAGILYSYTKATEKAGSAKK